MLDKLKIEISKYFNTDVKKLNPKTKATDIEGWDSLEHANLLLHLEDVFQIEFDLEDIINLEDLGSLSETIERKTNHL